MVPELFPPFLPGKKEDYQALYFQVYKQLGKDFYPYIKILEAPTQLSSEWLFSEVRRMLAEIIEKQPSALGPVIFRVDLTEKMVMQSRHHPHRLEELSALVLKREAQKIWIRTNLR